MRTMGDPHARGAFVLQLLHPDVFLLPFSLVQGRGRLLMQLVEFRIHPTLPVPKPDLRAQEPLRLKTGIELGRKRHQRHFQIFGRVT